MVREVVKLVVTELVLRDIEVALALRGVVLVVIEDVGGGLLLKSKLVPVRAIVTEVETAVWLFS